MNSSDLEKLLALECSRRLPDAPDLRSAVRREIARRQGRSIWSRVFPVFQWRELMVVPRFAVAAVALAVVAGVVPSAMYSQSSEKEEIRRARASLHLNVFKADNRPGLVIPGAS
jgi:hypothetical protein